MIRPHAPGLSTVMRLADVTVVTLGLRPVCALYGISWDERMTAAAAAAAAVYLLVAELRALYRSWRAGGLWQELAEVFVVWGAAVFGLLLLGYATHVSGEFSRYALVTWWITTPVLLWSIRIAVRGLARLLRSHGLNRRRAAVVGSGALARRVAETMLAEPWMGIELIGTFADAGGSAPAAGCRGSIADLERLARAREVDVVYLAMSGHDGSEIRALARRLSKTPTCVYFVPDLHGVAMLRSRWLTFGAIPTVSLFDTPLGPLERAIKRMEDLVVAAFCAVVVSVPMALIAVGIKLTSPGPVIYRQRRYGLDGRRIVVHKFRTMAVCEGEADFSQAQPHDPRVTRLGGLLRSTSLDELPQLFDVLRGDMSMVGPRPHPVRLDEAHQDEIDWYMLRQRVKPGITGWAQINGLRGETETPGRMARRIQHDLEYIQNWSLWLDLKILARTPWRGVIKSDAY